MLQLSSSVSTQQNCISQTSLFFAQQQNSFVVLFRLEFLFINFNFSNDKQRKIIHLQQSQIVFFFRCLLFCLISRDKLSLHWKRNDYNLAVSMKIKSLFKFIRLRSLSFPFYDLKQQPFLQWLCELVIFSLLGLLYFKRGKCLQFELMPLIQSKL